MIHRPSMSKFAILVICFLAGALLAKQVSAQPPTEPTFISHYCRISPGNYTTNSSYETNLRSALFDLQHRASSASFSNTSAGSGKDQVFGQYYCRGDIDSQLCLDCVTQAAAAVFKNCRNFRGALISYDLCSLRYQNISMVGVMSIGPVAQGSNPLNVTDPETFSVVVGTTFDRIINSSAYGNQSAARFATDEGIVSQFVTVYCLGQCSPDMNGTQCETCLHTAYDNIPAWWSQAVAVFLPSCQVRYSMQGAFYALPNAPPPPSVAVPSLPPPSPVATSSPPKGSSATMVRSRESMNLGIGITAVAFFIFQVYI